MSKQKKADQALEEAEELKTTLEAANIRIKAKAGEGGKLFGAITSKDVADRICEVTNIDIDKKKISMDSIKELGVHEFQIKLHPGVVADMKISVEEE